MYNVTIIEFQMFIREVSKKIMDSNNDLKTLTQAKKDYELIKSKTDPEDIANMDGDNFSLDSRFESLMKMGFDRVEERKVELADTSCPFTSPF